jgi:crotonobetainyl-CoA:carnitine CoA-transferase CaiB-like acyl-CoA transferase
VLDVLGLVELVRLGDAPSRTRAPTTRAADGIHVLDLTRVIAGPVCTRTLAAHGADVLRVDTPALPEIDAQAIDALPGKRSAFIDLKSPIGDAQLEHLLGEADVLVTGYRPGSLHQFGLAPATLAARHPGLVVLNLCAWGPEGPWAGRRGFDSLVQAASGIAVAESPGGDTPGVLPAQALDHATGYLAAAAILVALERQQREGDTWLVQCSLAQTASWLLRQARIEAASAEELDVAPYLAHMQRNGEVITLVTPPGAVGDHPLEWPSPPPPLGSSPARWRDTPPSATWASSG